MMDPLPSEGLAAKDIVIYLNSTRWLHSAQPFLLGYLTSHALVSVAPKVHNDEQIFKDGTDKLRVIPIFTEFMTEKFYNFLIFYNFLYYFLIIYKIHL